VSSLDFSELPCGEPVVVAIHGVLGADQRLEAENPAIAEGQLQLDAVLQNTLEIADTPNFTEAIKPVR
jgi:hypothetical protein